MRDSAALTSASLAVESGMYAPPLPTLTQVTKFSSEGQGWRTNTLAIAKVRYPRVRK
jgi:hypothetical protein